MTKALNRKLLLIIFCFAASGVYAQGDDDLPGDPTNPDVPISGLGVLLAAGAAYGAKKAYDIYRKKKDG